MLLLPITPGKYLTRNHRVVVIHEAKVGENCFFPVKGTLKRPGKKNKFCIWTHAGRYDVFTEHMWDLVERVGD